MTDDPREERIEELRALPAVGALLVRPALSEMIAEHGHATVVSVVRDVVARARDTLSRGGVAIISEDEIRKEVRASARPLLRPAINATGVIAHTNLGRAPLAREAIDEMQRIARGYSTLEYDASTGRRGHRHAHVVSLCRALTGAEDALIVNNNAAAILLALAALARDREAIASRGELVEIGGGFRIPEIIAQSGARLVEVGTTNRTHLADYEAAISENTAILLKVHRSNFEMVGFTAEVEVAELAALAHQRNIALVYDAGSGCMPKVAPLVRERAIEAHVEAGADVVTFSGDKLLGGPQAGIAVGRRAFIERMRRHPLYRALRPDKLTIAALGSTLALWRDAPEQIPLVRMLNESVSELDARCRRIAPNFEVVTSIARVGGGAAPSIELESRAILVRGDAERLAELLRAGDPPIVARIEDGVLMLDVRCIAVEEEAAVRAALEALP